MRLDLGSIIHQPGGVIPFSIELDFSSLEFGGSFPAKEPVTFSGQVRNEADVLVLTGTVSTTLHCSCDRCAAAFTRPFHQAVEAILVQELMDEKNEDVWTVLPQDGEADLLDIATTAFVLNLDTKFLCSADCKGLCAVCGKNLNEGPCRCKPEPDPRLAVLKQLLQDKE